MPCGVFRDTLDVVRCQHVATVQYSNAYHVSLDSSQRMYPEHYFELSLSQLTCFLADFKSKKTVVVFFLMYKM